jgi:Dolichyl-phosphate-mannose-protein mannosyltransferase
MSTTTWLALPRVSDRRMTMAWLAPLCLFTASALLYSINLGRLPHPDELHHMIAAHGLLTSGEPRIAEGFYTRVLLHTWLVAKSYQLFGESTAAARVPSVVAMAACVALVFVWVRREAGGPAAWWSAVLLGTSPFAVGVAQFVRFYALQALVFTALAMLVYYALTGSRRLLHRLAIGLLALPLLALGVYLQPTTLLGCVGLALWAVPAAVLPWLRSPAVPPRHKLGLLVAAIAAGLIVIGGLAASGLLGELWQRYHAAPLFIDDRAEKFWYYHGWLSLLYPTLWPMMGILALVAVCVHPAFGSFALVTFSMSFLLNSFAAAKGLRYMVYAQPQLFILCGLAIAALWPALTRFIRELKDGLREQLAVLGRWAGPAAGALVLGALTFLLLANPMWLRSVTTIADIAVPPEQPRADWPKARASLMPWIESAEVVVSTEELGTLYFLGRFDLRFSPSKLEELAPSERREFGIDHRTGRPVISLRTTLQQVIECYRTGIVLGPATHWGAPHLIDSKTLAVIENGTKPLQLPPRTQIRAQVWDHGSAWARPAACIAMPDFPKTLQQFGQVRDDESR